MNKIFTSALAAGLALSFAAPLAVAPAHAQAARTVGVVSLPAVVANSNAFKTAQTQRQTTYKAQIDQAEARRAAIAAQLQPLITKFNTDRTAASPNQQALQQQAAQIQQIEAAGQRELQQLLGPVGLSQAYVQEQIEDRLDTAVQAAARKKNITLILDASQGAVVYADAQHNITQDVINELNAVLPSAQLVPPQGWVPREIREQQQAAAQAQGQTAAQPAPQQQPSGR